MQEAFDNSPSELLTRSEELSMLDTEDLIRHILRLELELSLAHNAYMAEEGDELNW